MNQQNNENLEQLFEKFLAEEQASQAAQQIQQTDEIINSYPAPKPKPQLLDDIKTQVETALLRRRTRPYRKIIYKAVAAAAAIIIVMGLTARLLEKDSHHPPVAQIVSADILWDSDDLAADDADLVALETQIDEIQTELVAVQRGQNGINGIDTITELETELSEINGDFWKG